MLRGWWSCSSVGFVMKRSLLGDVLLLKQERAVRSDWLLLLGNKCDLLRKYRCFSSLLDFFRWCSFRLIRFIFQLLWKTCQRDPTALSPWSSFGEGDTLLCHVNLERTIFLIGLRIRKNNNNKHLLLPKNFIPLKIGRASVNTCYT